MARVDIVQDTSVFVAALRRPDGGSGAVLRRCLVRLDRAALGAALLSEYEAQIEAEAPWRGATVTPAERRAVLEDFCAAAEWRTVWFTWRPNLPDEGDNHVYELAVAAASEHLVTHNVRDFRGGELKFLWPRVVTPAEHLAATEGEP